MVWIESHHNYELNAVIPMQVAESLFGHCENSGEDLDQLVTDAIREKLQSGLRGVKGGGQS